MFNRLHIYTVHVNPARKPAFENPVFVNEGFSIGAFVFTFLWTLYNRLWFASAMILASNMLIMALQRMEMITEASGFVLMFAQQIIVGMLANDWLRAAYKKRGHIMAGIVTGESRLRAEQRFFEQYVATTAHSLPA